MKAKMRVLSVLVLIVLALLLFLQPPSLAASAETGAGEGETLDSSIDELLSALDLKELQAYLDTLSEFRGISVRDRLKSLLKGGSLDYASLGQAVMSLVVGEMDALLPAFAVILAVALLCGVLNSAKNGFLHSTMSDIINYVCYLAVGGVTLSCFITALSVGFGTIEAMRKQMELLYPLLLTLMAASGGSVSAAIFRPAVAFMSGGILELFASAVLPASVVVLVLAFLGDLSDSVRTEKLGDFFKSAIKWIVGLALGLFSLFLTVQGITAAQYDGISLRTAKYVLSGSVPLVGGFLSGGVELVVAGSALIKNALGAFAIFLLFGTLLRPLLLFAALQLFLRLSAAVTEPAGGKVSALLSRLAGDMGYFIAGLLTVAFLYFLTVLLLVCSTGVIF